MALLDLADQRFTGRSVADQCCDPADLRETVLHGERDVEQFVVNADAPQGVARRNRGVAAGQHQVGPQRDDLFCRFVRDGQMLRQRSDG